MFSNRIFTFFHRSFHSTPVYFKSKAGRFRISKFHNKPLNYDQAFKPHDIAVAKGWVSVHTGQLHGEEEAPARIYEDQFIRKFLAGTFHRMISTHPVIKRRFNIIEVIVFMNTPYTKKDSIYFLRFYSERLLSSFLKCNVKLYIHHVEDRELTYKYV